MVETKILSHGGGQSWILLVVLKFINHVKTVQDFWEFRKTHLEHILDNTWVSWFYFLVEAVSFIIIA